jgi:hypothetical protein
MRVEAGLLKYVVREALTCPWEFPGRDFAAEIVGVDI